MQLLYSRLSEKDRRQYAALETIKLGRGGMAYISTILGVDRGTILQGIKELTPTSKESPIPRDKQRRAGGGRKKNGKKYSTKTTTNGLHRNPQSRKPNGK